MTKIQNIAPLQLIVVGFSQPNISGRILDEINKLREHKQLKIVDGLVVQKHADGTLESIQVSDLPKEEAVEYGAIIGFLIGMGSSDENVAETTSLAMAMQVEHEYEYGINPEDLSNITEDIPAEGAALILLIEHLWALPLRQAVRDAGGVLIAQDFLSPETLIGIGKAAFAAIAH